MSHITETEREWAQEGSEHVLRLAYEVLEEAQWHGMGSGSQPELSSCPICRE